MYLFMNYVKGNEIDLEIKYLLNFRNLTKGSIRF